MLVRQGDELPVSILPCDGTYPTGTSKWEKRNIAQFIAVWDTHVCVQCGKCVIVFPHAVIRAKAYQDEYLNNAPATFKSAQARDKDFAGERFTIQVAPEDCTGCGLCVDVCPAKNKSQPSRRVVLPSMAVTYRQLLGVKTLKDETPLGQTRYLKIRLNSVLDSAFLSTKKRNLPQNCWHN